MTFPFREIKKDIREGILYRTYPAICHGHLMKVIWNGHDGEVVYYCAYRELHIPEKEFMEITYRKINKAIDEKIFNIASLK